MNMENNYLKNGTLVELWAIPIWNTFIEPISNDLIQKCKELEFERMYAENGDYSKNKFVLHGEEFAFLREQISKSFSAYVFDILKVDKSTEFKLTTSWVVRHKKGDWGQAHLHTNSVFSGVVYLDVDESSGKILFNRDLNSYNISPPALFLRYEELTRLNSPDWGFSPKNNQVFFFPSHTMHSIGKNESENERYSLAFNFFPYGRFGTKESALEIR